MMNSSIKAERFSKKLFLLIQYSVFFTFFSCTMQQEKEVEEIILEVVKEVAEAEIDHVMK